MTSFIGRREFIALVGGATAWPVVAGAQQPARCRRLASWGYGLAVKLGLVDRCVLVERLRELRLDRGPHRCDRISLGGGAPYSASPRLRPSSFNSGWTWLIVTSGAGDH